jgi:hypothetical protein
MASRQSSRWLEAGVVEWPKRKSRSDGGTAQVRHAGIDRARDARTWRVHDSSICPSLPSRRRVTRTIGTTPDSRVGEPVGANDCPRRTRTRPCDRRWRTRERSQRPPLYRGAATQLAGQPWPQAMPHGDPRQHGAARGRQALRPSRLACGRLTGLGGVRAWSPAIAGMLAEH